MDGRCALVCVNYSSYESQCYVRLPFTFVNGTSVRFGDLMSPVVYDRDGSDLATKGLFLDLPAWGYHVFEVGK
jgi:hypothetical protein